MNYDYIKEPDTEVGNLRAALMILLDQHEQFTEYSERMRKFGKGISLCSPVDPEYAQIMLG